MVPRGWPYNWQPPVPVTSPGKRKFFSHRLFFAHFLHWSGLTDILLFRAFSALVGTRGFFVFSRIFCIGRDLRIFLLYSLRRFFMCMWMNTVCWAILEILKRRKMDFPLVVVSLCKNFSVRRNDHTFVSLSPYVKCSDSSFKRYPVTLYFHKRTILGLSLPCIIYTWPDPL